MTERLKSTPKMIICAFHHLVETQMLLLKKKRRKESRNTVFSVSGVKKGGKA